MPLLEFFAFLARSVSGWRFLGSRSYRKCIRARWSQQRQVETMQEIIGALIGMLLTGLVPLLLIARLLVEERR